MFVRRVLKQWPLTFWNSQIARWGLSAGPLHSVDSHQVRTLFWGHRASCTLVTVDSKSLARDVPMYEAVLDLNETGLHRYYRDRLSECYLSAQTSLRTVSNPPPLSELSDRLPYHLIVSVPRTHLSART